MVFKVLLISLLTRLVFSFPKGSTTALTSTQRNTGSLKALNKHSLDTLFSNMWLLEEKNGKDSCYLRTASLQNITAFSC